MDDAFMDADDRETMMDKQIHQDFFNQFKKDDFDDTAL